MGYIFAFDLSLSCVGTTVFSNDARPKLVTSVETKSEKEHQKKLKIIADYMLHLREIYDPDLIIIEGGFSRFNASTQAIYKCHGICQYLYHDIPQIFYPPSTVKKVVGFRGNMKKDDLRKIIQDRCNIHFCNNDESDSYAVGLAYFIQNNIIEWKQDEND